MSKPVLKTAPQVREELDRKGISIAEFARTHNLDQRATWLVLSGRNKGRRGEAHKAAVVLGIKAGTIDPASN
ncbi:TPA: DNA-binding protein [Stenotrophomonas maltophilia]|jgi:gp16 family phage-associated protein|uniref:Phage-associated protein, BcepMu gp16 family n=1 Tax=Stenotrophomonas maltophilia TaxID=40324 RepID=A0AB34TGS5_STEMA|nr:MULTISPECIES: DNA-binding protein [Stenotrophomonas]PJO53287.1 DNA-binding protein [Stenotrophomonas lactitubi]EKT4070347.1 DNA-binding protein [Stenotrophomonas maltophilia]EKT4079204.1 DNA-binding protein [Stenotrophomonas maltophilia]KOO82283.1 phage-associated protein, BcepMu gp16 family [Stenotrophomonas maltophilia]MCI1140320.1 DNA-binding protein [Stenotrophomonas maltophilia]